MEMAALLFIRQHSLRSESTLLCRYFWKLGKSLLIIMANLPQSPRLGTPQALAYAENVWDETFHRRLSEVIPLLRTMIVKRLKNTKTQRTDEEIKECETWDTTVGVLIGESLASRTVNVHPLLQKSS
jgi:hypothetical protein